MSPLTRHILFFAFLIIGTLALAFALPPHLNVYVVMSIGFAWVIAYVAFDPFGISCNPATQPAPSVGPSQV